LIKLMAKPNKNKLFVENEIFNNITLVDIEYI